MSSQTPHPALPREFEHPALQELVVRGRTHGSVAAAELRTACEVADVQDAKRLRAVVRGLATAGITVSEPVPARAVAATSAKSRPAAKATVGDGEAAAKPVRRRAAPKAAAPVAEAKTAVKDAPVGDDADEPAVDALEEVEIEDVEVDAVDVEADSGAAEGDDAEEGEKKPAAEEESEDSGFVYSDADDDDAPAQQVVTAGATADPVKDYLKQIGKVALLNAEQEVELAKRIEAGLFAEERLNAGITMEPKARRELEWIAQDGRRAKNHLLEANLRLVVSLAKR
ncbi:MAG: sigma-70 factor domain-containing protein, partial [Brevundimonas sp.]